MIQGSKRRGLSLLLFLFYRGRNRGRPDFPKVAEEGSWKRKVDKEINSSSHTLFLFLCPNQSPGIPSLTLIVNWNQTSGVKNSKVLLLVAAPSKSPGSWWAFTAHWPWSGRICFANSRWQLPSFLPSLWPALSKQGTALREKQHDQESCIPWASNFRVVQVVFHFLTSGDLRLPTAQGGWPVDGRYMPCNGRVKWGGNKDFSNHRCLPRAILVVTANPQTQNPSSALAPLGCGPATHTRSTCEGWMPFVCSKSYLFLFFSLTGRNSLF